MPLERLQKILAQCGVASRRASEKLIISGKVRLNGKKVKELGTKADVAVDKIEVEGVGQIAHKEENIYIVMHKPIHVITSTKDPEGRKTVIDILEENPGAGTHERGSVLPRLYPIGRLDFDAEGVLLLTNDGTLAQKLMHPKHHAKKTYAVKVKGHPNEQQLEKLRQGIRLPAVVGGGPSRRTAPAAVKILKSGEANAWLELVVVEGLYHLIKRMCQTIGHQSLRIIRTEFAGVKIDNLLPGEWRFLKKTEIAKIQGSDMQKNKNRISSKGKGSPRRAKG